ncbi:hypothetical protein C8F01DRAFT_1258156 [Mycena amicta]|nr:hypothetical protein C8F01DRAFT_1258156 [Mycena amicta]
MSTTSDIQTVGLDDEAQVVYNSDSPQHSASFFSNSKQFTITGGTFTGAQVVTNHFHYGATSSADGTSDFRRIPFGDIDLQHEIRMDDQSASVYRRREHGCVRRVYSARIDGRKGDMTVAMFQGRNAEEEWRQTVLQHSTLRHPNIIQLYGVSSSSGVHAVIYHDGLIPFESFLNHYRHSHFLLLDLWTHFDGEQFEAMKHYLLVRNTGIDLNCGYWIRPSNGRICLDLLPAQTPPPFNNTAPFPSRLNVPRPQGIINALNDIDREATLISSLTLTEYQNLCYWILAERREIPFSALAIVKLGAVLYYPCSTELKSPVEIVPLSSEPNLSTCSVPWMLDPYSQAGVWRETDSHVMENNWTRWNEFSFNPLLSFWVLGDMNPWLSQSNHIMKHFNASSYSAEDYAVVQRVDFRLMVSDSSKSLPNGYLFLAPASDFELGPSMLRWPDCPAYWSLDPTGVERLSAEEAEHLGFPALELITRVHIASWDDSVYAGIRRFQRAKGFDPYTQDVARKLGHLLYELPVDMDREGTHGGSGLLEQLDGPVVDEELEEKLDSWTFLAWLTRSWRRKLLDIPRLMLYLNRPR